MNIFPDQWERASEPRVREGGQGRVQKVRNVVDGKFGALKTLHERFLGDSERRYRMVQEVLALRKLAGVGVPAVLNENSSRWEEKGVPLFAVLQWIDGPTLHEHVDGKARPLDECLDFIERFLVVLARCHDAGFLHRDIKPDNIILAGGNPKVPYLVDFGMAWSRDDTDEFGIKTGKAQELGNRFLRLPEFAPGAVVRDARSYLTLTAGVLMYMVSGVMPRVLEDAKGLMPHEASEAQVPEPTRNDRRWPRLKRLFTVAFQRNLSLRHISAASMAKEFENLEPLIPSDDPVAAARARLDEALQISQVKALELSQSHAKAALTAFLSAFHPRVSESGFQAGGNGPNRAQEEDAMDVVFYIVPAGGGRTVHFKHRVLFGDQRFQACLAFEEDTTWQVYYTGSLADPDSLTEACAATAPAVLARLLDQYTAKITPKRIVKS